VPWSTYFCGWPVENLSRRHHPPSCPANRGSCTCQHAGHPQDEPASHHRATDTTGSIWCDRSSSPRPMRPRTDPVRQIECSHFCAFHCAPRSTVSSTRLSFPAAVTRIIGSEGIITAVITAAATRTRHGSFINALEEMLLVRVSHKLSERRPVLVLLCLVLP